MIKFALLANLVAKPGKEQELQTFLTSAAATAQQEPHTINWYSFKINASTFGIFDTFEAEEGRQEHLKGEIAKVIMEKASEWLASPPVIEQLDILGTKSVKA